MNPQDSRENIPVHGQSDSEELLTSEAQLRRLHAENQRLLSYLDKIESLWVRLQKQATSDKLFPDLLTLFLGEVDGLFPIALSAVYRVDPVTFELSFERAVPAALQEDLQKEAEDQIAQGAFGLALRRSRPTVFPSLGLHHHYPQARTIVLVPLVALQGVYGMALIATERKEQDITPLELKLLSIQAGQTASALESAQHGRLILLQDRVSEPLEGPAFPQQELSQEPTRATEPLFNVESVPAPCQETAPEKLSANTSGSADTARSSPVTSSFPEQEYADFLSTPETDNSEEFLEGYRPARRWWVSSEVVLVAYLVVALGVLAFLWLGGENQLPQEKPHYAPLLSEPAPSSPAETEALQGSSPAPPAPPAMPAQSSLDTPQPQDLTPPSPGPSVSPERKAVQQTSPSHQLTATAIEKTWLRVIIDDEIQKDLFLNPGQKAEWSAQKGFLLNVGNAGGVRLTLDGTELPQLGASGRVIRNLRLPAPEKSG